MKNLKTYWQILEDIRDKELKFIEAISRGDVSTVTSLLDSGFNPNTKIPLMLYDVYPIIRAVQEPVRTSKMVQVLLNAGANPNVIDNYRNTPLMIAISKNNLEVIDLLLQAGADPNDEAYLDTITGPPLKKAKREYLVEAASLLLKYGADPHQAFNDIDDLNSFFEGNEELLPKRAVSRMKGRNVFGM